MITYREFRPTGCDAKGLGLPENQDWLVAPVTLNRDSTTLERSNWEVVTDELNDYPDDVEIHRFGHWACGWFEIMLVRPDTKAAKDAQEWEDCLSDYPVADENHFSNLQYNESQKWWEQCGLEARIEYCKQAKLSIFAARRPIVPVECLEFIDDYG